MVSVWLGVRKNMMLDQSERLILMPDKGSMKRDRQLQEEDRNNKIRNSWEYKERNSYKSFKILQTVPKRVSGINILKVLFTLKNQRTTRKGIIHTNLILNLSVIRTMLRVPLMQSTIIRELCQKPTQELPIIMAVTISDKIKSQVNKTGMQFPKCPQTQVNWAKLGLKWCFNHKNHKMRKVIHFQSLDSSSKTF